MTALTIDDTTQFSKTHYRDGTELFLELQEKFLFEQKLAYQHHRAMTIPENQLVNF